jgi:D-alanine--poly(phosphoribitol) ligase subunit 2
MQDDAILTRVVHVLTNRLAREAPRPDADLFETGVLDSLGFADLLVGLEDEFHIHIPLEEIDFERFRTLAALRDVLRDTMAASVACAA